MNYTIAAIGVVFLLALISWVAHGRKQYTGPRNLDLALEIARRGLTEDDHAKGRVHPGRQEGMTQGVDGAVANGEKDASSA